MNTSIYNNTNDDKGCLLVDNDDDYDTNNVDFISKSTSSSSLSSSSSASTSTSTPLPSKLATTTATTTTLSPISSPTSTMIQRKNSNISNSQHATTTNAQRRDYHRSTTREELLDAMTNSSCTTEVEMDSYTKLDKKEDTDHHHHKNKNYYSKRKMTPLQERVNAITVLPAGIYCLYFCFSNQWVNTHTVAQLAKEAAAEDTTNTIFSLDDDATGCFLYNTNENNKLLGGIPLPVSFPPLPIILTTIGVLLSAPCSCIYHWKYAIEVNCFLKRIEHWSRRLDQSMIHIAFCCFSYTTSGSFLYFLINLLFSIDSIHKQFQIQIIPRRNQIRLGISTLLFLLPILFLTTTENDHPTSNNYYKNPNNNVYLFLETLMIVAISFYFFIAYPIGGWSHSVFHLLLCFLPVQLMKIGCLLPISQTAIQVGAKCTLLLNSMKE